MTVLDRPRLRRGLAAARDGDDERFIYLIDQMRIANRPHRLTWFQFVSVQLFDGRRTLRDIQADLMSQTGGQLLPIDELRDLVRALDEALFLDGERFQSHLAAPVREPSCIGCYEGEPASLRQQLERLFTAPGGPGLPGEPRPDDSLRAALLPHIDFARGGVTFAWGFKEILERTAASLFVIIGTSHYSAQRFTLTRKCFKTPLGITPTDEHYIDRLVAHYGDGLFDDELAHLPEHSIELELVFLQWYYAERRPIRMVPLVVGSFYDRVDAGLAPAAAADIGRMIGALRQVEAEINEPICYLISGDLAHIGPKFGDNHPVHDAWLDHSRQQDHALIDQASRADADGYFRVIAAECDQRRICGLPPTYTVLEALRPSSGRLLHYDQFVHSQGHESVSFASMIFER
jgi:AmmeMemoRadiSam system protein B